MKQAVPLAEGIYWVGAVDYDVRVFHGHHFHTPRGTTYNAYLVTGEKTALVDSVHKPFAHELVERVAGVVPWARLDYIIVNHLEPDHSGALPVAVQQAPQAQLVCSEKCAEGLQRYYGIGNVHVVGTGDSVDLGGLTLQFLEARMLHWPDSMFTYVPERKVLLPNDAFGQHFASSARFDDEVDLVAVLDEASKYYANILNPVGSLVTKKLAEVQQLGLEIETIGPSHGIIWRRHTAEIVEAYARWAQGVAEPRVIVAYDTMWGSTERMARAIVEGVAAEGVEARPYRLPVSDRTAALRDAIESAALVVGTATINRRMLPTIAPFLDDLAGLRPKKTIGFAFGSHGWNGGGMPQVEAALKEAGVELIREGLTTVFWPAEDDLAACVEAGRDLARRVRGQA